ncbi:flavin-containing monooxygenase [Aspergillus alliaceus]|uniref:flavin-containing monooxygenase n=1 Tax=Petromyces alliaceus TaxID=209559 RepID=UPI0012A690B2|nr:uncharacterized protein BDW43DRAFT_260578 [Aspergillus alliaceus]KAB8239110.1 hypothetical protein BDW43DRAFT_260578 [Aspergillus alliaceus]
MTGVQTTRPVGNQDYTSSTVTIIGAGLSGLCIAIDILKREQCRNIVILEKGSQVGGTWNDSRYPGCACDVWAALYSFSFEQKTDWSREYPGQEELRDYVIHVAEKYSLYKYIRFNTTVQEARWDDKQLQWKVNVAVSGAKDSQFHETYQITTNFLVSAVGQLNVPSWPSIPGLDDFTGKLMHSARWDWTYDFTGKRVAIIGNGATSVQIVPELAKSVSQLTVYQRTPNWIIPRYDADVSSLQKLLLSYVPPVRWCKRAVMMQLREATHDPIVKSDSALANFMRKMAVDAMKSQLRDKPELWDQLIPNYSPGCKRVIVSDDYFVTLNKKNVDLETRPIQRVTESGIETADGDLREYDLVVVATGFRTVEFMHPIQVYGRNGRPVSDVWKEGATAYYGVTVEDLPNFGMLYGPNTNLEKILDSSCAGHNSIILMIEAQSRYLSTLIGEVVRAKARGDSLALQPRTDVVSMFNDRIQAELGKSSFADPNCHSWYKLDDGRITNNWPGRVVQYQKEMSQVRWEDYLVEGTGKSRVDSKKTTNIGRIQEELPVRTATLVLGALGVALAMGGYYMNGPSALLSRRRW